MLMIKVGIV
jgi:hypothetical protein